MIFKKNDQLLKYLGEKYQSDFPPLLNVNYFPIIRNYINNILLHEKNIGQSSSKTLKPTFEKSFSFKKLISFFLFIFKSIYNNKNKPELLFVSENNDLYPDMIQKKLFSRYKDPYFYKYSKIISCGKIYITDNDISQFCIPGIKYSAKFLYNFKNLILYFFFLIKRKEFSILIQYLNFIKKNETNSVEFNLSDQFFLDLVDVIFWHLIFIFILKVHNPCYIISSCYFISSSNYGLFAAAKSLKIPSIEIQHGSITSHYRNWIKCKSRNKLILPDYYLTWNSKQTEQFIKLKSPILPITGNNEWIRYSLNNNNFKNPTYKNSVKKYLFIHQYLDHEWNTRRLKLILDGLVNYQLFYILHPLTSFTSKEYIKEFFKDSSYVTIFESQKINLMKLIYDSDCLITRYSASSIEAVDLDTNVLLIDEKSLHYFEDYTKENKMIFLNNIKEIISFLNNLHSISKKKIIKENTNIPFINKIKINKF